MEAAWFSISALKVFLLAANSSSFSLACVDRLSQGSTNRLSSERYPLQLSQLSHCAQAYPSLRSRQRRPEWCGLIIKEIDSSQISTRLFVGSCNSMGRERTRLPGILGLNVARTHEGIAHRIFKAPMVRREEWRLQAPNTERNH